MTSPEIVMEYITRRGKHDVLHAVSFPTYKAAEKRLLHMLKETTVPYVCIKADGMYMLRIHGIAIYFLRGAMKRQKFHIIQAR